MTWWDTHAADRNGRWPCLVQIAFTSGTVYWTDSDIPVVTGAGSIAGDHRWTPRPLVVHDGITSRQAEVTGASIEIGNADNVLFAILFAGSVQGVLVNVFEAGFEDTNKTAIPDGLRWILRGRISAPREEQSGTLSAMTFTIGPVRNMAAKTGPGPLFSELLRV